MNSEKVADFIAKSCPAPARVDETQVAAWSASNGLVITPPSRAGYVRYSLLKKGRQGVFKRAPDEELEFLEVPQRLVEVEWSIRHDLAGATYTPSIKGAFFEGPSLVKGLLEEAGIRTVHVGYPEPVVELPIPPWAVAYSHDFMSPLGHSNVVSIVYFESEAKELVHGFMDQLRASVPDDGV